MKILKIDSVTVAGYDYDVNYVPHSFNMGALNRVGEADFINQTITINEHLHPDQQLEVFLHELVHVLIKTYGIPMPEDENSEEDIVERFGKGLFQVCKDNDLLNPNIFNTEEVEVEQS